MFPTSIDNYTNLGLTKHQLMGIRHLDGDEGAGTGDDAAAKSAANAAAAAQVAAAAQAAAAKTAADAAAAAGTPAEKVEDLPPWAQKLIKDTREEAATHRTNAKAAAESATQELTDKLAVALGLKPEPGADPVEVAKKATASAAQSARELAVYKAAAASGADPVKLLDRASFLTSIQSIDSTDGTAIAAAIKTAVDADATLKAARAAAASSVDTTGGTGEQGQITEEQLAHMSPEQIEDAYRKGLLKDLL